MKTKEGKVGAFVLSFGNVAGMIDLVALPLWISGLMQAYTLNPQQAGLQVTLYLFGLFIASVILAPRFHRISPRIAAIAGYGLAAVSFLFLWGMPTDKMLISAAHFIAGLGAGIGLSAVHGTIGRSANPGKLFGIASFALGASAVPFYAIVPGHMAQGGGIQFLFAVLAGLMLITAVMSALVFPSFAGTASASVSGSANVASTPVKLSSDARRGVILAFIGVAVMATAQAMAYSFVDRLGAWRGFAPEAVARVFVIGSFINLTAPLVAMWLLKRVTATSASVFALVTHALLTFTYTMTPVYWPFLVACSCFVFFIIFSHTFIFGLIARLDPSGRASASTPAMLTIGATIGPVLGGTVINDLGFPALGIFTAAFALAGAVCFFLIGRSPVASVANRLMPASI